MDIKINKETYRLFDSLRFPLIVGIVCSHTLYFWGIQFGSQGSTNSYMIFRYLFSSLLPRVCVPMFLFISGYLFYYNIYEGHEFQAIKRKLKKRFSTLFIPFVLWNIFQIGYYVVLYFTRSVPMPKGILVWLSFFYNDHGSGEPINTPLWYVLELMMFSLMSPLFIKLLQNFALTSLSIVLILYLFTESTIGTYFDPLYFLYYLLGAYMGYYKINVIVFQSTYKSAFLTFLLLLTCFYFEDFPKSLYGVRTSILGRALSLIYITITMFFLCKLFSDKLHSRGVTLLKSMAVYTFFIYCFHFTFPFNFFDTFIEHTFVGFPAYACITVHIIMICFKLAICIMTYHVLLKTCPSFLQVLIGKRQKMIDNANDKQLYLTK